MIEKGEYKNVKNDEMLKKLYLIKSIIDVEWTKK